MKSKILVLLFCLTLLFACASKELVDVEPKAAPEEQEAPEAPEPAPVEQGEVVAKPVEKTVKEPEPAKEVKVVEPEEPAAKNTPDVQKVLDRYEAKTKSYEFYYAPPPDNLARHRYYVLGDKVRIDVYEENYKMRGEYIDTIYLDLDAQTATGYCRNKDNILCGDVNEGKEESFEEWNIVLPHHYLEKIEGATKEGSETLYDRKTYKLSYEVDGVPYTTWVDEFSGIPLRVKVGDQRDSPKWEFREVGINSILPEDVTK